VGENGAFGFDPDDLDRVIREGSEGLRDVFERLVSKFVRPVGFVLGRVGRGSSKTCHGVPARVRKPPARRATGCGRFTRWAPTAMPGSTRSMQPSSTRCGANKNNVDPMRKVRFLPYGIGGQRPRRSKSGFRRRHRFRRAFITRQQDNSVSPVGRRCRRRIC